MKHATLLALGLLLATGIAWAAEDVHSHASAPHKTIVLDTDRVSPSALVIDKQDVIEFENYAGNPMTIVFVEPADQLEKIHCHLIDAKPTSESKAPWLLFEWNAKHQLTATIPPGQFASLCSLAPGDYAFVSKAAPKARPEAQDTLGTKGTITVR